jgi:hypothetical protein
MDRYDNYAIKKKKKKNNAQRQAFQEAGTK